MNRVEYVLKLYVKEVLKWDWPNWAFNIVNFAGWIAVAFAMLNFHGTATKAELQALADAVNVVIVGAVVWPFLVVGLTIAVHAVGARIGRPVPEELWPEVELP